MTQRFELYPAIDLKDGQCVRLLRGEMNAATTYNPDPAAQATEFEATGFSWVHVVDLNGAFEGDSRNSDAVKAIRSAVSCKIQLGGGIRDLAAVDAWLDAGVTRVILGTAAVRDPDFVRAAARAYPDRIVVGIDAREGQVAVSGWAETTNMAAIDLAQAFEDSGVAAIVFTDISRDGTKTGVNVAATGALADAVSIPVVASGGVANLQDLRALKAWPGTAIDGAILGRALYDGDIDPGRALDLSHG